MTRYETNPKGQKIPVYTREDLARMNARRRDATIYEIWPVQGKPKATVFFFDMGKGELRPSVLIPGGAR